MRAELPERFAEDTEAKIREKASGEVRTVMGLHRRSQLFARLCRHPRFVLPARQLLGTDQLYVQRASSRRAEMANRLRSANQRLKRRHGLRRCRYRGVDGMGRWVGPRRARERPAGAIRASGTVT